MIKHRILRFIEPSCRYTAAEIGIAVFGKVTRSGKTMTEKGACFAISKYINEMVDNGEIGRWRYFDEVGRFTYRYGYHDKGLFDE